MGQEKAEPASPLRFAPAKVLPQFDEMPAQSQPTSGRSGNYLPTIWDYDVLESLLNDKAHDHARNQEVEKMLEDDVRKIMRGLQDDHSALLSLIDDIQKLGMSYRFEEEIFEGLERLYASNKRNGEDDLQATALCFRILRQHGFPVSPDEEFGRFIDHEGKFLSSICNDIHGLLTMYEASYYGFEGEDLLDEANAFARKHLINLKNKVDDRDLADQIDVVLELPMHHRPPIHVAKHTFRKYNGNASLRELAKLNFELSELIWWRHLDLQNRLGFSRDRIVEIFHAVYLIASTTDFSDGRKALAKTMYLLCNIDDLYDVYGSLEELRLFTKAIDRWDVNDIDELPEYMRTIFLALCKTSDEMAQEVFKKTGFNCLSHIKEGWRDLCKAFMVEAEWYFNKQVPTFKDFLDNGWRSIGSITCINVIYFYLHNEFTQASLDGLNNLHDAIRYSCILARVVNDLGTEQNEQERGDAAKSIKSYVHEKGVSIKDARKHMKAVIKENWKMYNKAAYNGAPPFSRAFLELVINLSRSTIFYYGNGDAVVNHSDQIIGDVMNTLGCNPEG
ncbi:hypothetical protein Drorol1_Dr00021497 [Drosera rotundifolia]